MQEDVCPAVINLHRILLLFPTIILVFLVTTASASVKMLKGRDGRAGFTEKEILDMLLEGYDNKLRPKTMVNGTAGAAVVAVNLLVRSISKVDDLNMEYATQLTFREEWNDDRLAYDDGGYHKYLVLPEPEKVWKPDLFFQNEKSGHLHNILVPNNFLRIHPSGDIMMSIRISLVLACAMDLRYFPMDRQTCEIRMASYGYTTDDIEFFWKAIATPVQMANFTMPRFKIEGVRTGYCTSVTATGAYSCLLVHIYFQREFSYYLVQVYVPTFMLICVSWVSFWLDPEATPARVSLGVTTLLTMATTQSGINAQLPPVSYTKAIDVWTGVCISFIFGALLEFAFVNYCSQKDKAKQRKQDAANKREEAQRKEREMETSHSMALLHQAGALSHAAHHSSIPNQLHLHHETGTGTLGKKSSQTSLDHYYAHQHRGASHASMARRSQRSPVYRTISSGSRLDAETELLEVERNPSAYAMKPLLSQRSNSKGRSAGNDQSSFMATNCPECNDMGIGEDDYHNYEGDLHIEVDETAHDEGDARSGTRAGGGGLVARHRSAGRSKGSIRCTHDPHFTLLSNPAISAAELEAGNGHHRGGGMANHVGGGSRKDLHEDHHHNNNGTKKIAQPKQRGCFGGRIRIPSKRAKQIDFFSRLIFPLIFLFFNIGYWNAYFRTNTHSNPPLVDAQLMIRRPERTATNPKHNLGDKKDWPDKI